MSLERCRLAFVNNERQQRNACNNHNTLIPSILGFSVFITIINYLFPYLVFFSPLHRKLANILKTFLHVNLNFDHVIGIYINIYINKKSFDIYLICYAATLFNAALFVQFLHT